MPSAPISNPTPYTCGNCGTGWNRNGQVCPNCGTAVPPHSDRWVFKVVPWIMGLVAVGSAGQGYDAFQAARLVVHARASDWLPVAFNFSIFLCSFSVLIVTAKAHVNLGKTSTQSVLK